MRRRKLLAGGSVCPTETIGSRYTGISMPKPPRHEAPRLGCAGSISWRSMVGTTVGIVSESLPGERRVAMTPGALSVLKKTNVELLMESGAGVPAGMPDAEYAEKGVRIASRRDVFAASEVILQVRSLGANLQAGRADLAHLRRGQAVIGFGEPLTSIDAARDLADRGVSFLSMELMPRITRAQSMDALSSMATIAGYKAALMAADSLPRMFPMLMTAAGTVAPARVLVLGAGVAGCRRSLRRAGWER